MGKEWDHGVPGVEFWTEALRVAKPGAHLLAFGGTRTYHRLACAIEDAGWEIRDCVMWVYGSGFPKSHDVSKAIDKAAGAEREVVSKAGRETQLGEKVTESWTISKRTGRLRIADITAPATDAAKQWAGWGTAEAGIRASDRRPKEADRHRRAERTDARHGRAEHRCLPDSIG
jgi:hypothetical protein